MARFLIQSAVSWEFLHHSPRLGDVAWTPSLQTAMAFGIADDVEEVAQLIQDHCDGGRAIVIDLDKDYTA